MDYESWEAERSQGSGQNMAVVAERSTASVEWKEKEAEWDKNDEKGSEM